MRTRNRFARVCSEWARLVAGAALGVMLGSTAVLAGPTSPPIGTGGPQLTAASTKTASGPRIEIKAHKFSLPTVSIPVGNVLNFKAGGLGSLGREQLEWLQKDVAGLTSSTPIVLFAHVPLWAVYPKWGWVTEDAGQALGYLKRFGSVTVLNGHIHQVLQKVEGHVAFHSAMSTAFPQPAPGAGPGPGPLKVPADQLRGLLGVREVSYVEGKGKLAVVDSTLT